MSKGLHSELEQNTRAFLDNLQQKGGPPIYTLSPYDARAVLSGFRSSKISISTRISQHEVDHHL
jgi:hypothetical protein